MTLILVGGVVIAIFMTVTRWISARRLEREFASVRAHHEAMSALRSRDAHPAGSARIEVR